MSIKYGNKENQEFKRQTREQERTDVLRIAQMEENLAKKLYPPMSSIYDSLAIVAEEATESLEHTDHIKLSLERLWKCMREKNNVEFRKQLEVIELDSIYAIEELLQLIAVCRKSLEVVPESNFEN